MDQGKIQGVEVDALRIPEYNGMGTFTDEGSVVYHVSLPLSAKRDIARLETMDLWDTIFVRIVTTSQTTNGYLNPRNEVIKLQFTIEGFHRCDRTSVNLYLWHDNTEVQNEVGARIAMGTCTPHDVIDPDTGHILPRKCGKGVLSYEA